MLYTVRSYVTLPALLLQEGVFMKVDRIETDVWHVVLFFWLYRLWRTFASSRTHISVPSRSNICEYWRTLLLGGIAGVGYVVFTGWLLYGAVFYPSKSFGFGYWMVVGSVALVIALIVGVIILVVTGKDKVSDWLDNKSRKLEEHMEGTEGRPSIFAIIREYIRAKNAQMCTQIEFVAPVATSYRDNTISVAGFHVQQEVRSLEQAATPVIDVPMLPVSSLGETSAAQTSSVVLLTPHERVRSISTERVPFLPVWWSASIFSFVLLVIFGVFVAINESNTQIQAVWEGECSVSRFELYKDRVGMVVDCRDKHVTVYDQVTIVDHLNSKAPLQCFESGKGDLYCSKKDQKRKKMT